MSANPLKVWTDGELFHGDDFDRLCINTNMRFTSAAQRDAALVGDYALAPGMHAALQDDHLTYKYTGTVWQPPIGTAMFDYVQSTSQSIVINTWVAVTGYTTNQLTRNWGNWFNPVTGRFTPLLAGFYELAGSVTITHNTETGGSRQASFRLNAAPAVASLSTYTTSGRNSFTVYGECKPTVLYFNGSTDYADIAAYQSSGATLTMSSSASVPSRFAATYQGA